jgi:hypothetical protein
MGSKKETSKCRILQGKDATHDGYHNLCHKRKSEELVRTEDYRHHS